MLFTETKVKEDVGICSYFCQERYVKSGMADPKRPSEKDQGVI